MEDVSTRVLDKIKHIYEGKPKKDLMYQDKYNCICQITKKIKIFSINSKSSLNVDYFSQQIYIFTIKWP